MTTVETLTAAVARNKQERRLIKLTSRVLDTANAISISTIETYYSLLLFFSSRYTEFVYFEANCYWRMEETTEHLTTVWPANSSEVEFSRGEFRKHLEIVLESYDLEIGSEN